MGGTSALRFSSVVFFLARHCSHTEDYEAIRFIIQTGAKHEFGIAARCKWYVEQIFS